MKNTLYEVIDYADMLNSNAKKILEQTKILKEIFNIHQEKIKGEVDNKEEEEQEGLLEQFTIIDKLFVTLDQVHRSLNQISVEQDVIKSFIMPQSDEKGIR
jgi:uncharacterized tellurite resistance protein B-like protein